jgi:phage I-like protein
LCKIHLAEGEPPEWVQLLPAGERIEAVDGRVFSNPDPVVVIDAFNADPNDIPLDWEHSTQLKGAYGDEAPAAGWIVEMEAREGSIWGRVEWTERGAASVTSKEYRYLSPAFIHDDNGRAVQIVSASLTNNPALRMAALAQRDTKKEGVMLKKLLELLGLDESTTEDQAVAACRALMERNTTAATALASSQKELGELQKKLDSTEGELALARSAQPSLDKFVPRADYDTALARAAKAEETIAADRQEAMNKQIDCEIEAALKAGKITPATSDYHRAQCSAEGGLERFREFVKSAPVVAPDQSNFDDKPKGGAASNGATPEQIAIARRCGLTKEEFLAGSPEQD